MIFSRHICLITLSKRVVITAIEKPVGEADVLTFKTQRTLTQSQLPLIKAVSLCSFPRHVWHVMSRSLGQNIHWAVQRVMFYRSQAGIRAWPRKSNIAVRGDMGSPSAETQCCETKHKSINVAKVLKTKVNGSVNIPQYDLWGTWRNVGDFKKTGEVTWKAAAERGDSKKGSWYWLSSELFGYPGSWNREGRNSPGSVKGPGAPEVFLSAVVLVWCWCLSNLTQVPLLHPFRSGYKNAFLPGEQDSGFSACKMCQSTVCVHPLILEEHKVACPHLLL